MATLSLYGYEGYFTWTISGLSANFTTASGYLEAGITEYSFTNGGTYVYSPTDYIPATSSGGKSVSGTVTASPGTYTFYGYTQTSDGKYYSCGSDTVTVYSQATVEPPDDQSGSVVSVSDYGYSQFTGSLTCTWGNADFYWVGAFTSTTSTSPVGGGLYVYDEADFTYAGLSANTRYYLKVKGYNSDYGFADSWSGYTTLTTRPSISFSATLSGSELSWEIDNTDLAINRYNYSQIGLTLLDPSTWSGTTTLTSYIDYFNVTSYTSTAHTHYDATTLTKTGTYTIYAYMRDSSNRYWLVGSTTVTVASPEPDSASFSLTGGVEQFSWTVTLSPAFNSTNYQYLYITDGPMTSASSTIIDSRAPTSTSLTSPSNTLAYNPGTYTFYAYLLLNDGSYYLIGTDTVTVTVTKPTSASLTLTGGVEQFSWSLSLSPAFNSTNYQYLYITDGAMTSSSSSILDSKAPTSTSLSAPGNTVSYNPGTYTLYAYLLLNDGSYYLADYGTVTITSGAPTTVGSIQAVTPYYSTILNLSMTAVNLATEYYVYYRVYGSSTWGFASSTTTTCQLTGLTPNTTYEFYYCGHNGYGSGPTSDVATALTLPGTAGELTFVSSTSNSVTLKLEAMTGISNYRIYYGLSPTSMEAYTPVFSATEYTVGQLAANTTYYFKYCAVNNTGEGTCSDNCEGKTKPLIDKWDWYIANGNVSDSSNGASAAQTTLAYQVSQGQGLVSDFNYRVWNDMCDKVNEVAKAAGSSWLTSYATFANTKMTSTDRTLTSTRFNSLNYNIRSRIATGIADQTALTTANPVRGPFFATLMSKVNEWIDSL